jgi:hypothetical protein
MFLSGLQVVAAKLGCSSGLAWSRAQRGIPAKYEVAATDHDHFIAATNRSRCRQGGKSRTAGATAIL